MFHVKQGSASARGRGPQVQPALDHVQSARAAGSSLPDGDKAGGRWASARAGRSFCKAPIALEMRNQKRERCRRDAVHSGSLADGARTGGAKLLADFIGEAA